MACIAHTVSVAMRPAVVRIVLQKSAGITAVERKIFNSRSLLSRFLSTTATVRSHHKSEAVRKYTDKHEWVSVKEDVGTVGISDYAQESLGEIVFVQLPQVGDKYVVADEVGALEGVKAASEVYSPVSGEVVERNEEVEETPNLINRSCYEKGWLFKVRLDNPDELQKLMDEEAYHEYLKTQAHD